uniref:5'-nucleotidase domain-containing protein 1 n=1 Tax=Aotus nancymaae TaxID=37293 RepID=A0A2K5E647_AOTNA
MRFSLAACNVDGFNLDHILCRYNLPKSTPLIYNSFALFLVKEKGYDKELLNVTPEYWDFCFKSLALDLEDGNFLKLADNGTVLKASHDTKMMTPEVLAEAYGKKEWKHFLLDTGWLATQENIICMTTTLTWCFKENCGIYFPEIKRDPGRYSHSDYCRLFCKYILGNDFADLFDIVITNALKPGFFSHLPSQRPFRTLENHEQEALPSLDKHGWCSQGNAVHLYELLKKMTGKPEPKIVYFGDSMHSDTFPACHYSNWETILILKERRGDGGARRQRPEKSRILHLKNEASWAVSFIDSDVGLENTEGSLIYTWSCKRISTYSTIAIPNIGAIAELLLDYKFTRFSSSNSKTAGYYPYPPLSKD